MSKIVKHTLSFENEYEYELLGICSHVSDYKLVWNINEKLNIHLEKALDMFEVNSKKGNVVSSHPYYFMIDEENRLEMYLIKNKHEGKFLIPEKQQIDYFLFVCNNYLYDLNEMNEKLREIECILASFDFDPQDFQSTQLIVFE
jgi:hypothetical protein